MSGEYSDGRFFPISKQSYEIFPSISKVLKKIPLSFSDVSFDIRLMQF